MINWQQLLSSKRLGSNKENIIDHARNSFQQDFDRIVFSASFRRLQDKTQVFSLATPDYVRTRLTHSLETSCVGRSLGMMAGAKILEKHKELLSDYQSSDFGAIVAAACLGHDIGNPPFGHNGEAAISYWFKKSENGKAICKRLKEEGVNINEFLEFEGNAQGFRILTKLEANRRKGGLQLTCATLATFMKYPHAVDEKYHDQKHVADKKYGYFNIDQKEFEEVFTQTGLLQKCDKTGKRWCARHPLAYLVEAADDLCYRIVDIEDGYRQKLLDYHDIYDLLTSLLKDPEKYHDYIESMQNRVAAIEFLRAKAVGEIIKQLAQAFEDKYEEIMNGQLTKPLIDFVPKAKELKEIFDYATKNIYCNDYVYRTEVAGFAVLGKLIDIFLEALNERVEHPKSTSNYSKILISLIPTINYMSSEEIESTTLYERVLLVNDYVSSLTDRKAVSLYKQLTGISIADE